MVIFMTEFYFGQVWILFIFPQTNLKNMCAIFLRKTVANRRRSITNVVNSLINV